MVGNNLAQTHFAFSLPKCAVRDRILIPKLYDPDLEEAAKLASKGFKLIALGDLLYPGDQGSRLGSWIKREWYGTGAIPYVRTSDLSHWRVRPDYKKGVAEDIYNKLKDIQDVEPGDVLFVAHGTYLVGTVAMVTADETKLVLQDHVFRLRVNPETGIDPHYLLAALSTAFVLRQVRARQFSADIIDKIGNRHLTIKVPVPKDPEVVAEVVDTVRNILDAQTAVRRKVRQSMGVQTRMLRERAESRLGFGVQRRHIHNRILVPKFYDPQVAEMLRNVQADSAEPWQTIADLVNQKTISLQTGIEVGKMAYGTGNVPFVRTSDIADLEIKRDTRHCISERLYKKFELKAAIKHEDIVLVRDGTYLVGSSAMATEEDLPALICGGLYRVRVNDKDRISPYALLVALNQPIVRQQMRSKQFTRDVIDTLGERILEVYVPPLYTKKWRQIGEEMEKLVRRKVNVKQDMGTVIGRVEPPAPPILQGRPSWSMR